MLVLCRQWAGSTMTAAPSWFVGQPEPSSKQPAQALQYWGMFSSTLTYYGLVSYIIKHSGIFKWTPILRLPSKQPAQALHRDVIVQYCKAFQQCTAEEKMQLGTDTAFAFEASTDGGGCALSSLTLGKPH